MMGHERARVRIERVGGTMIAHLLDREIESVFGECNDLEELPEALNLLVDQGHFDLVLDFQEVRYMCSAFLHPLWTLQERLTSGGGRLRLRNLGENVLKVFEITRLSTRFAIE